MGWPCLWYQVSAGQILLEPDSLMCLAVGAGSSYMGISLGFPHGDWAKGRCLGKEQRKEASDPRVRCHEASLLLSPGPPSSSGMTRPHLSAVLSVSEGVAVFGK